MKRERHVRQSVRDARAVPPERGRMFPVAPWRAFPTEPVWPLGYILHTGPLDDAEISALRESFWTGLSRSSRAMKAKTAALPGESPTPSASITPVPFTSSVEKDFWTAASERLSERKQKKRGKVSAILGALKSRASKSASRMWASLQAFDLPRSDTPPPTCSETPAVRWGRIHREFRRRQLLGLPTIAWSEVDRVACRCPSLGCDSASVAQVGAAVAAAPADGRAGGLHAP